ncbi:hypothetical protein [Olsenella uli]|uniref:hypothetical protein n=1 Tax=Olsenella uli TaxID=133926 RepID=UPI0012AC15B1|nr:hypothetical protein [Olsenella uli]
MSARSDILTLGRVPHPLLAVSPDAASDGREDRHMAIEPVRGAQISSYTTQSVQLVPSGARSAEMVVTGAAPRLASVPLVSEYSVGAAGVVAGRYARRPSVAAGGRVASRPVRPTSSVRGARPAHERVSVAGARVAARHAVPEAREVASAKGGRRSLFGVGRHVTREAAHRPEHEAATSNFAAREVASASGRFAVREDAAAHCPEHAASRASLFVREAGEEPERSARPHAGRERIAVRPAVSSEKAPRVNLLTAVAGWAGAHRALSIAMATVLVAVAMLYPPARAYYAAVRVNSVLSSQLSDVNASNDSLQSDVSSLMTKEGIEDEARRRGYVSKGDTAVDMSGVSDSGGATSDQASATSDDTASSAAEPWYLSALDALFGYDPSTQGVG